MKKKEQEESKEIDVQVFSLDQQGKGVGSSLSHQESTALLRELREQSPFDRTNTSHEWVPIKMKGLLPGETAQVEINHLSQHKKEAYATVKKRYSDANDRVQPQCLAYGSCGGCALQHLAYSSQLLWKKKWLQEALDAYQIKPKEPILFCTPAPNEGYEGRRQAKFVVAHGPQGIFLGSYAPDSHQVIDMRGCKLIRPSLEELAQTITFLLNQNEISVYHEHNQEGFLRYLILRESSFGQHQLIWIVTNGNNIALLQTLSQHIQQKHPSVQSVLVHKNDEFGNSLFSKEPCQTLLGSAELWEEIGPIQIRLSAHSFVQANHTIAQKIYHDVATALSANHEDHLLDLYCGVGGIGLTCLKQTPGLQLTGVEENPFAIEDAKAAVNHHHFSSREAQFLCGDAKKILLSLCSQTETPSQRPISLVCINPPRKGCDQDVIKGFIQLKPRILAYVSCNPKTLARDLSIFVRNGYQVENISFYDLHPHSPHIEALAVLIPCK